MVVRGACGGCLAGRLGERSFDSHASTYQAHFGRCDLLRENMINVVVSNPDEGRGLKEEEEEEGSGTAGQYESVSLDLPDGSIPTGGQEL